MSTASELVALARPKGTLLLLAVPLTGYGFAHWDHQLALTRPASLAFVLVAWTLLSAGSLWLNAVLDGDEGGVLFAKPAKRPAALVPFGNAALLVAVLLAFRAGLAPGFACAACAVMAVLYSNPKTMWKAHPVLGPFVNGAGYGVASFFAGFSATGTRMTMRSAAAMLLLALFVVGMSLAAQAYQRDDDTRRGYRTLVVTRGPTACLRAATWCMRLTLATVTFLCIVGVYPRVVLFGLPVFAFAEITMARWRRDPTGGTPADAAKFATRMLAGGVVLVALAAMDSLGF